MNSKLSGMGGTARQRRLALTLSSPAADTVLDELARAELAW